MAASMTMATTRPACQQRNVIGAASGWLSVICMALSMTYGVAIIVASATSVMTARGYVACSPGGGINVTARGVACNIKLMWPDGWQS